MGVASNATTATILSESFTRLAPTPTTLSERERIRMEFYQTYDVMTGIRIAATLGGFFALMVLLVVYKSKCKSRVDETLEAAITAAVAEEEELEAVLSQGKFDYSVHGPRQSLGNMSAPAYTRFLSVGGYGSLMNPPTRRYERGARGRVSLPASDASFRYFHASGTSTSSQDRRSSRMWKSYDEEEENDLDEIEESDDFNETRFLQIPSTRRKISVELSPSFSFERKGSCSRAEFLARMNRNAQFASKSFNPINIKVIQPTPQISPSESSSGLQEDIFSDRLTNKEGKLAPLASIGSCSAISSIESENRSLGSDSVFITSENIEEDDTDKEANEEDLSSAKSDQDCTNKKYRIVPTTNSCFVISGNPLFNSNRRFSDSHMQNLEKFKNSPLPIVTNLMQTNNQTITSVCSKNSSSSSSSTSLSSNFCSSNSTTSDARKKGIFSRIAIIDTSSPKKTDKIIMNKKRLLSKSEPVTINFKDSQGQSKVTNLKTLSLKNLVDSDRWTQETLF